MPIRFVDRPSTIAGRVAVTLESHAPNFDGSFTAAPTRTGTVGAQLQNLTPTFVGQFQSNANRVGTIGTTLSGMTAAFFSGSPQAPAAADWTLRQNAQGVVWSHDFSNAAEVDNFRWQGGIGNVPNIASSDGNCRRITTDGIGGGSCLEINIPTGGTCASGWWRPLSALNAGATGNGKSTADQAAGGTLTRRSWDPTNVNCTFNFMGGYYGHQSYVSAFPTWTRQSVQYSNIWDGTEYWLQFRVKIPQSRFNISNPDGKLVFLDLTSGQTGTSLGEIVLRSEPTYSWVTPGQTTSVFRPYGMFGDGRSFGAGELTNPQGGPDGGAIQPGYNEASCKIGTGTVSGCWYWPADEWVTMMVHFKPARHSPGPYTPTVPPGWWSDPLKAFAEAEMQIYVARAGESEYTLIHDKSNYAWLYGDGNNVGDFVFHPPSHNSVAFSGYMNGVNAVSGWSHRFTQAIFSKQWIECPAPTSVTDAPQWSKSASLKTWIELGGGSGFGSAHQNGTTLTSLSPGLPGVSYSGASSSGDQSKIITAWTGGCASQEHHSLILPANGGHGDYWGNEVYEFQLKRDVPRWVRLTDPTPASVFNGMSDSQKAFYLGPNDPHIYPDGRPRSLHNAGTVCYGNGRVWLMGLSSPAAIGFAGDLHTASFNRASLGAGSTTLAHDGGIGPWAIHGSGPTAGGYSGFNCGAYDRKRQMAWGIHGEASNKGYWSISARTNAIVTYTQELAGAHFGGQWAIVAHDLDLLIVSNKNSSDVYVLDLKNPSAGFVIKATSGGQSGVDGWGAVYHRPSSAVLAMDTRAHTNGEVRKLKIPRNTDGSYNASGAWVWTTITKAGGPSPAHTASDYAGTYGKFNLIENLGDGHAWLVLVTGTAAGRTYAYKLPNGEVT